MTTFEQRTQSAVRSAVVTGGALYFIKAGASVLVRRREARGRRGASVVRAFKIYQAVFGLAGLLVEWNFLGAPPDPPSTDMHIFFFVLFAVVPLLAATLAAWLATFIVLGSIELVDTMRGTQINRRGHFATVEELGAQMQYWAQEAGLQGANAVGGVVVGVATGLGAPLGGAIVNREYALKEMARVEAQMFAVARGGQVWINNDNDTQVRFPDRPVVAPYVPNVIVGHDSRSVKHDR